MVYLQNLCAVFDPLLCPDVQDGLGLSEARSIVKRREETHADGAGHRRDPATFLVERLQVEHSFKLTLKTTSEHEITPGITCVECWRFSCLYGVEADGVGGLLWFRIMETNS